MARDEKLTIEPDIHFAWTLPGSFYRDEGLLARLQETVFPASWQLVADTDRVRVPGQVYPLVFLEGAVPEPLLVTRDRDDRLCCFSNVCTHRGALVCEGPGIETQLRCRYHGRRFGLDGRFVAMPEFEAAVGFPSPSDDLPRVPFGTWEKLLFVSLAPRLALDELLAPIRERCGFLPLGDAVLDPARSRDYLVRANWALYCDNYLEGFHIPYVHAGLAQALDYGAYRTELFPWATLQVGVAEGGEETFALPAGHPDAGQPIAAYYWWLFPNTMLNFYPWGLSVNVVKPFAVDRTKVSFLSYVWDPAKLDRGAGSGLDRVEREDEAVVESVQRGVSSRLYRRGRFSPTRESGVHHFHALLARALDG